MLSFSACRSAAKGRSGAFSPSYPRVNRSSVVARVSSLSSSSTSSSSFSFFLSPSLAAAPATRPLLPRNRAAATTRAKNPKRGRRTATTKAMASAAAKAATSSPAYADAERALGQGRPDPPLPTEFLRWVRSCNAPPGTFDAFLPWRIGGVDVGLVRPGFAEELRAFPEVFRFVEEGGGGENEAAAPTPSSPTSGSRNSSSKTGYGKQYLIPIPRARAATQ